jgi:hypothetical protein
VERYQAAVAQGADTDRKSAAPATTTYARVATAVPWHRFELLRRQAVCTITKSPHARRQNRAFTPRTPMHKHTTELLVCSR